MNIVTFKKLSGGVKSFHRLGAKSLFKSLSKQIERIQERRKAIQYCKNQNGLYLLINPGVYRTGVDTELMLSVVKISKHNTFLEIGCGTGAISLFLSQKCQYGVAADINSLAVKNAENNCILNNIKNLSVIQSNVFENVQGCFDVIVCNPPYNDYFAKDEIEMMFWDPNNMMKKTFFRNVNRFLKNSGTVYFGWADFEDIDFNFPIKEANENGLKLIKTYYKPSSCNSYRFIVFMFKKSL